MSRKISDEEFIERVKNIDWSNSNFKPLELNKMDLVLEKLDKIIELLTTNLVVVPSISKKEIDHVKVIPLSVTSNNEHSFQAKDINEALLKIAAKYSKKVPTVEIGKEECIKRLQEVDFNYIDTVKGKWEEKRRLVIERNSNGKRLREGLMNNDGSIEWTRTYS